MNSLATSFARRCGNCSAWTFTHRERGKRAGDCSARIPALPASVNPVTKSVVTEDFGKTCPTFQLASTSLESVR